MVSINTNANTQGERRRVARRQVRFVEVPSNDYIECGVRRRELYIPLLTQNGDDLALPLLFPGHYHAIPRRMNWDWVEEMKELVGNATENGYKIDHNSFLNNIIRPNLRKLQVDCRDPEFAITDEYLHLHNEYLFASAIFERGSPEALAEIAGGFRDLYLRRTN